MQALRHEEFHEGCQAFCNGRYDGMWSKTMAGYGAERSHFVVELTYNYTVTSYAKGNDFAAFVICSDRVLERVSRRDVGSGRAQQLTAEMRDWLMTLSSASVESATTNAVALTSPDGYTVIVAESRFHPAGKGEEEEVDPVAAVVLNVKSLEVSLGTCVEECESERETHTYTAHKRPLTSHAPQVTGPTCSACAFSAAAAAATLQQLLLLLRASLR